MTTHDLTLNGCTSEPLMNYLKALGVLRLVSEQKDEAARGFWRGGALCLRSSVDDEHLMRFFLQEYEPTPITAPWNGGSGYYLKWDPKRDQFKSRDVVDAVDSISRSTSDRLSPYREAIEMVKRGISRLAKPIDLEVELRGKTKQERTKILNGMLLFDFGGQTMAISKSGKDKFLAAMRSMILNDESLLWLDSALVLITGQKKNRLEAPILGSGGNVGNSDFSGMFIQAISEIIALNEKDTSPSYSDRLLESSVWGRIVQDVPKAAAGQFWPGRAGGANQTQGQEGSSFLNPWDYVLMCEGALLLGGTSNRRLSTGVKVAAFPFSVRSSRVGYGSSGEEATRGEIWLPLWDRPCGVRELKALFGEGRADISGRTATTGVDFSRSVASLGIDRGIDSFIRYEFQERLGQSYIATPLGHFRVKARPDVDLLDETDRWLERYRRAASSKNTPPRFMAVLRQVESAIFAFCRYGGARGFAEILCAFGKAEKQLGRCERLRDDRHIRPLSGLSPDWLRAANDGSVEFELALSLAGIYDAEKKIGPIRANLEPVTWPGHADWRGYTAWAEGNRSVVWNSADLCTNLAAILQRRLMDGDRAGCGAVPLAHHRTASLEAVATFIAGETDDTRLEDLLWGMFLVNHAKKYPPMEHPVLEAPLVPRTFALLRLLFLTRALEMDGQEVRILREPGILPLLRAGRVGEACRLSMRRLRASGLAPMPHRGTRGSNRDEIWEAPTGEPDPQRLGAALLFPISSNDVSRLAVIILRPGREADENT